MIDNPDYDLKPYMLSALIYSPFHGLTYLSNRKAGCTTIKYSLWKDYDLKTGQSTYRGKTHRAVGSPFLKGPKAIARQDINGFLSSQFFTVVRNPYSRILSAYLHKVRAETYTSWVRRSISSQFIKNDVWRLLAKQAEISQFTRPSFVEFLRILASLPVEHLPPHFRPQSILILYGYIPYDFIGYLEDQQPLQDYLADYSVSINSRRIHAKNADRRLIEYYGQEEQELVQKIYRNDFSTFGYSTNIGEIGEAGKKFSDLNNGNQQKDLLKNDLMKKDLLRQFPKFNS